MKQLISQIVSLQVVLQILENKHATIQDDEFAIFSPIFDNNLILRYNFAAEEDPHLPGYIIPPVLVQLKLNQASLLAALILLCCKRFFFFAVHLFVVFSAFAHLFYT